MKTITIQRLTLANFKGCRSLALDFHGRDCSIYGDNATGKTTVYDAFCWLLFGKDSVALDVALNALTGHTPEPSADVSPALANEARAERLWDDDRRLFVRNLGWLLSQTRCGVVSCELYGDQDREYVIALYDHGGKREIDVTADSYLAIIKDVTNRV